MHLVKCALCGARSGLIDRQGYVGGSGYSWAIECANKVACARRQEVNAVSDGIEADLKASREQRRVWS